MGNFSKVETETFQTIVKCIWKWKGDQTLIGEPPEVIVF